MQHYDDEPDRETIKGHKKPRRQKKTSTRTKTMKGWNRGPVYIKETEKTEEQSDP